MGKILDYLFLKLLRRELRQMDQFSRYKILDGEYTWYVQMGMKDDGYNWDQIDIKDVKLW